MQKGNPLFFFALIDNFPYIKITDDEIKKMGLKIKTTPDINDHFYFIVNNEFINPQMNPRKIGTIGHCPYTSIEGCEFDTTIGINTEAIDLIENIQMYQPKDSYHTHLYQFDITNPSIGSLKVYLYSFSGDGELQISKDQYFIQEVGKYYLD